MNYPFEQINVGDKMIRTFSPEVDDDELKWHQDLKDRKVTIIESGGWSFQMDNDLPNKLKKQVRIALQRKRLNKP